jgi:protein Mpv17
LIFTGILTFLGDLLAQQAVERSGWRGHDWHRSWRLTMWGFVIAGPFTCAWYYFLDRFVKFGDIAVTSIVRMSLDQFIIAPFFLFLFFSFNAFLEQRNYASQITLVPLLDNWKSNLRTKLKSSYWEVLKANWKIWPVVQCLNFAIVPLQYRLLLVNIVSLGWNAYLSVATNRAKMLHHLPIKSVVV